MVLLGQPGSGKSTFARYLAPGMDQVLRDVSSGKLNRALQAMANAAHGEAERRHLGGEGRGVRKVAGL